MLERLKPHFSLGNLTVVAVLVGCDDGEKPSDVAVRTTDEHLALVNT